MTVLGQADLEFDYDDEEDILHIFVGGRGPQQALSYETDEGHIVRLDPETLELVGAEIPSYRQRWEGQDIHLAWDVPKRPRTLWHAWQSKILMGGSWLRGDARSWLAEEVRHEEVVLTKPRLRVG